jgi:hypothetical protein
MYAAPRLPAVQLRQPRAVPPPPPPPPAEEEPEARPEPVAAAGPADVAEERLDHCPHCRREVQDSFEFCPGCGRPAQVTHQCSRCGREICTTCRPNYRYCPGCGIDL